MRGFGANDEGRLISTTIILPMQEERRATFVQLILLHLRDHLSYLPLQVLSIMRRLMDPDRT